MSSHNSISNLPYHRVHREAFPCQVSPVMPSTSNMEIPPQLDEQINNLELTIAIEKQIINILEGLATSDPKVALELQSKKNSLILNQTELVNCMKENKELKRKKDFLEKKEQANQSKKDLEGELQRIVFQRSTISTRKNSYENIANSIKVKGSGVERKIEIAGECLTEIKKLNTEIEALDKKILETQERLTRAEDLIKYYDNIILIIDQQIEEFRNTNAKELHAMQKAIAQQALGSRSGQIRVIDNKTPNEDHQRARVKPGFKRSQTSEKFLEMRDQVNFNDQDTRAIQNAVQERHKAQEEANSKGPFLKSDHLIKEDFAKREKTISEYKQNSLYFSSQEYQKLVQVLEDDLNEDKRSYEAASVSDTQIFSSQNSTYTQMSHQAGVLKKAQASDEYKEHDISITVPAFLHNLIPDSEQVEKQQEIFACMAQNKATTVAAEVEQGQFILKTNPNNPSLKSIMRSKESCKPKKRVGFSNKVQARVVFPANENGKQFELHVDQSMPLEKVNREDK